MTNLEWKRIEPTTVQKVGWRTVVTKSFILPNGKDITFDTVEPEDTTHVGVIALTRDNSVVVVNLYRPGPEKVMIEIPGGMCDGEESENAGLRELGEETGYAPSNDSEIIKLGVVCHDAYNNAVKHYYLITNVEQTAEQHLDLTETILVDTISIEQLIENARGGRMTDPSAVLLAYDKLKSIQKGE